jgi:hypothetical protein
MGVEGGHVPEDDAFVFEEGPGPLDGLFHAGTGLVHQLAKVVEDGLCERFGLGDV